MNQTISRPRQQLKGVGANVCYQLARAFHQTRLKRCGLRSEAITKFDSKDAFLADRECDLGEYRQLFRPFGSFAGKTVLDLGCNEGYLLNSLLRDERFTAIGADISAAYLAAGRKAYDDLIQFVQTTTSSIPLPDGIADIVYTVDTVEHLSRAREIFMDVHRILKPGGTFLVHFSPWLGPYGSHLEDIIPFPWPQTMFSMDTLLDVASVIYDSPDHAEAFYWRDSETGAKRPNPYQDRAHWDEYLNHMTVRQFNALLKILPFETVHYENIGFGGKTFGPARRLAVLARVPLVREYFTKAVFCVLRKPVD